MKIMSLSIILIPTIFVISQPDIVYMTIKEFTVVPGIDRHYATVDVYDYLAFKSYLYLGNTYKIHIKSACNFMRFAMVL